jgi:quercetin dioxygenase-like cupin family protein
MVDSLRLVEDRLTGGTRLPGTLPRLNRVLYVTRGEVIVTSAGTEARVETGRAWHGDAECLARVGEAGARVLRFELYRDRAPELNGGTLLLDHPIDLDPQASWLMRCDRVDFAPGGEAPWHRHRGGGIRCLLRGQIEVTVGDDPPRAVLPGGAWFESGREPVYAAAALDEETSFIRVTIQPAEIRGQSSIMYVNPAAGARKPRTYTVFIDEPITIDEHHLRKVR